MQNAQIVDPEEDSQFVLHNLDIQSETELEAEERTVLSEIESDMKVTAASDDIPGDAMVYYTQKWLNQEYGSVSGFGSVPENGRTGWDTVYGLLRALQHELGITNLANSFGNATTTAYNQNILRRQDGVSGNKMYAILQGALWCKGYFPGYYINYNLETDTYSFNEVFDEKVENAVIKLKTDAGLLNPDGVVTLNVMKALMSMDSFQLLGASYGGKPEVRAMQQKLNRKYEAYIGLMPCDGVYGRNTNKAIIYALQAEEKLPVGTANGNFGTTTKKCCPTIPYERNSSAAKSYPGAPSGSYYSNSQISAFTELLQFALYVNGFGDGSINGIYNAAMQENIRNFQKKYALPITGKADIGTWMSLFVSCGDTSRNALAADCATILDAVKAKTLYDNGYRYIGRYLTGTYNGGISKAITREEAQLIFDAGLRFFPIYQTSARQESYFTQERGSTDAQAAIAAASALGVPQGTIIYFAVDFDAMDYQITSSIIPYFEKVHEEMAKSIYRTGIYGTRNACARVSARGFACSSFVGDMSTGFSGNLGFSMPDNWAFDQFTTVTIGSGNGQLEIDKDGFSGRDHGVSSLTAETLIEIDSNSFHYGSTESDVMEGPTVEILGYSVPLFALEINCSLPNGFSVESEYDRREERLNVIIGLDLQEYSQNKYGVRERPTGERFTQAFTEVKTLVSAIGRNDSVFRNKYNDFKGSLYDRGLKAGVDFTCSLAGYISISCKTGKPVLTNGEIGIIAKANVSWEYPIVPTICARFGLEGSFETGLKLILRSDNTIDLNGHMAFSLTPSLSVGVNVLLAKAYIGVGGKLECTLRVPVNTMLEDFEADLSAHVFFEYEALKWSNQSEWTFAETRLYPRASSLQIMRLLSEDNLKLITPSQIEQDNITRNSDALQSSVQLYAKPQVVNLGNGKLFIAFIDDDSSRTAENSSIMMYSVYDGNAWSTPQPVLDDGTADFEPVLCADGNGGVHIVWQNTTQMFSEGVTLSEMSAAVDLSYIHWTGSDFDRYTAITSGNETLEMNHRIASSGNNLSVVWQENSDNNIFALTGFNSVHRRQFLADAWQATETIVSGMSLISGLDTSYNGADNIIAYSAKSSDVTSTINDLEVYCYANSQLTQLTNDSVLAYSVCLYGNELYWIGNEEILFVQIGSGTAPTTVLEDTGANLSKIKVIGSGSQKAIVWEHEDGSGMTFYRSKYNTDTALFEKAEPVMTKTGVVRGWDACYFAGNEPEFIYCYADFLETPIQGKTYGDLSLLHERGNSYYDLLVAPQASILGNIAPEEDVSFVVDVYNKGSVPVTQFLASITDEQGYSETVFVDSTLQVGKSAELTIPFTLPNSLTYTEYSIQISPVGGNDISLSDNIATAVIGFSDLAIENVQEIRSAASRSIQFQVYNAGYDSASAITACLRQDSDAGDILCTEEIAQLTSDSFVTVTFSLDDLNIDFDVFESPIPYCLTVEAESPESNYSNNNCSVHVYPDYTVSLTAESGGNVLGSGKYAKGATAHIEAVPAPGFLFEGWYDEQGALLPGIPQSWKLDVFSNKTMTAKFKETDFQISKVTVSGVPGVGKTMSVMTDVLGGQHPYTWAYSIYKENELLSEQASSNTNLLRFTPQEEGQYTVRVCVTDATGYTLEQNQSITIKTDFTIRRGESLDLSEYLPEHINVIYWESDQPKAATVDQNGIVYGKRVGRTTVTAHISYNVVYSWNIEVDFTWWQVLLLFTGIGMFLLPFWCVQ